MAQFDPTQRRETWLFQELGPDGVTGKPVYRALKYVLVSYDGSPDLVIEPIPPDEVLRSNDALGTTAGNGFKLIDPRVDGLGRMAGIQLFTSRPFEVHAFDDVDAVNNLGQLPPGQP